ncbi:MAG: type I restriction endonuclease subunit R [Anaerolineaceae bacterium]|jgi:type I restriction enzyme R subunit
MITEQFVEEFVLTLFSSLGYEVLNGPQIAPDVSSLYRDSYNHACLDKILLESLQRINPAIPDEILEDAVRKLKTPTSPSLTVNNRNVHKMLVNGIDVEYHRPDHSIGGDKIALIDFDNPDNNRWLVVNQFTVIEGNLNRRADVVVFINGLPLAVFELKNPADEKATIWSAFNQLQTYKNQISNLFIYNEVLVVSDGIEARIGSLTADRERFMPWKTIEGEDLAPVQKPQLEVLLRGVFEKRRFLDLLRYFIVFEEENGGMLNKKLAAYHQFHAVNVALEQTLRACDVIQKGQVAERRSGYFTRTPVDCAPGDHRVGVIWHTQGSGKSLTMAFYAGRVISHPLMENPTVVIITDRNDLDDQLFGTFSRCHDLLRQIPVQAENHQHLHQLLQVASGGVVFTTIQKFLPPAGQNGNGEPLSERRNIVVIADEAHRSQYDFIDGYARHMHDALPNASFIGFTGTPIEQNDRNTRAVFGNYVSVYDIQRAVEDGATVPIYYEGRLAKLELDEQLKPHLDEEFEEVTEGEELEQKERLKTKWAALEAVVGSERRIQIIARDFVQHFENRLEVMDGKAMIVCMSRRICVELYNAIMALRPEWHSEDDLQGAIKIVMTGSASDPLEWQQHIRSKARREELAKRFKNQNDPFKIVIVRDMWLTGFDAPPLHTMYVDKPMYGHGLMQAIARVNRVFKDKPGGLIVDYLGLADQLRQALANYTAEGGTGEAAIDQEQAVAIMQEKYEICLGLFHGFNWSKWTTGTPAEKLGLLPMAQEHIFAQEDGKNRLLKAVTELSQAFALAVPHPRTIAIRDDVGFFQAVRSAVAKTTCDSGRSVETMDHAIRQIISRAVASEEVIDIFTAAGLKKPDISILSDEFLAEIQGMPQHNLALELLKKLLNDEIKLRSRKNLVQSRSFSEMLERTIRAYQNRAIETAQVIEELISIAKEIREADKRGEELHLTEDEVAFYDALEVNDSAVKVLGDETLQEIARELVKMVRNNVTIDWTVKETVRAKLRVMVKRILRKYGYPPDKQEKATQTVLEQAELLARDWAE